MNCICLICSELLKNEDIVSTSCGHMFHRSCIESWLNSSRTCPTCRNFATTSTLVKLFFEVDDDQKANLQLDDILKTNDELTSAVNELKEKTKKLEIELRETQGKLKDSSANEKRLERQKQIDDMTIAGVTSIKNDSMKEIMKLNQCLNTLKLDLLAEKQLRRMHQISLHDLKPDDENYNTNSIKLNEDANGTGLESWKTEIIDFSKKEAAPDQPKKEAKPYIIPSKIQKGTIKETALKAGRLTNLKNQRSLWNKNDKPVGFQFQPPPLSSQHSTSSAAILSKNQKRAFGEGLVFNAPISATTSSSAGSSFFNFAVDTPTFPLAGSSSGSGSSSFVISTPLRSYRDVQEASPPPPPSQNGIFGPKISDR